MKMKKYGKMSPIFEFSISKLGYVVIFMKIWEKKILDSFFDPFLTNRGKNENEDKKFGKMSPIFEFFISKLGCMELSIKIWEKRSENLTNV